MNDITKRCHSREAHLYDAREKFMAAVFYDGEKKFTEAPVLWPLTENKIFIPYLKLNDVTAQSLLFNTLHSLLESNPDIVIMTEE